MKKNYNKSTNSTQVADCNGVQVNEITNNLFAYTFSSINKQIVIYLLLVFSFLANNNNALAVNSKNTKLINILPFKLELYDLPPTQTVINKTIKIVDYLTNEPVSNATVIINHRIISKTNSNEDFLEPIGKFYKSNIEKQTDNNGSMQIDVPIVTGQNILFIYVVKDGYEYYYNSLVPLTVDNEIILKIKRTATQNNRVLFNDKDEAELNAKDFAKIMDSTFKVDVDSNASINTANRNSSACTYTTPATIYVRNLINGYNSFSCPSSGYTGYMNMDEYVAGCVSGEMGTGTSFPIEAKKAQAVMARTYAIWRSNAGSGGNCGQSYSSTYSQTSTDAANQTTGQVILYNGSIIQALYSARCNGSMTQNANQGTYAAYSNCNTSGNYLAYAVCRPCSGHSSCNSIGETPCCYASNSCGSSGYIYGHGAGGCQRGCQGFANQGITYCDIINKFFTGICIVNCGGGGTGGNTPNLTQTYNNISLNGNDVSLTVTVKNNGTGNANSNRLGVYLSTSSSFTSPFIVANSTVPSINANSQSDVITNFSLCNKGLVNNTTYYLGYYIDDQLSISESDETDNGYWYFNTFPIIYNSTSCAGSSCTAPINLNTNNITQTSATISFTNGTNTTQTFLRYKETSASAYFQVEVTGQTSYNITGLTCGKSYECYLVSNCSTGGSISSNTIYFNTLVCSQTCTAASNINISSILQTTAYVSWTAPVGTTTTYLRYKQTTASAYSQVDVTGLISYTLSGLTCNSTYDVYLISNCTSGGSQSSTTMSFTTLACTPSCTAPYNISINNIAQTSVLVNWAAPIGTTNTYLRYRALSSSTFSQSDVTGLTSFPITNLSCGINYEVYLISNCSSGGTQSSSYISFTTLSCTPICQQPTNSSEQNIAQTSAMLTWTATNASIYSIWYRKIGTTSWITTTSTTNSFSLTGLDCNTQYEWICRSDCSVGGSSAFTANKTFKTLACTQVCYGANYLVSSNATANSISLAWQIGDNSTKKIMYKKSTEVTYSEQTIPTTTQTTYTLTGLECDKTYNIYIQSVCGIQTYVSNIETDMTSACPCNTILNTPIITGDNIKCPNNAASVSISNPQTGVIYRWSNGSSELSTTYNSAGNISVVASLACNTNITSTGYFTINNSTINLNATANKYSICVGETVLLNATGATNYIWSGLLSSSNGANATSIPLNTGVYQFICTGYIGNCSQDDTVKILVGLKPSVSVNSVNLCEGQIGYLTAIGNADSYRWSNGQIGATIGVNPTTNTNYSVTASKNGCDSTVSTLVQVKPYPIINITASPNDTINAGQTCVLNATGANSYNWSNGQNLNLIQVTPSTTTMYTVTGTNIYGTNFSCTTTKSITITVRDISTGLKDNKLNDEIKIYPNPASDFINIELKRNSNFSIEIFDELGQIAWRDENKNDVVKIPTSNFASGIYLIKIQTENEFGMKKIIINK